MEKTVALIEDEITKRDAVYAHVESLLPDYKIVEAKSVKTGRLLMRDHAPSILLLDMSLPTFEVCESDSGGRPQGLGGIEIMRYMLKDSSEAPVIVVTGYQEFSERSRYMSVESLMEALYVEFPDIFKGLVIFNVLSDDWKEGLSDLISEVVGNA